MHKVLIVDDEIEICRILSKFFELKGFQAFTAYSGEDALKVLKEQKIDIMILDIRMPGMGGVSVLKELRSQKNPLPVIILTGSQIFSSHENEIKMMQYNDIMVKPVELNKILDKVNAMLASRRG
jgi:putative two-component system response regulator